MAGGGVHVFFQPGTHLCTIGSAAQYDRSAQLAALVWICRLGSRILFTPPRDGARDP